MTRAQLLGLVLFTVSSLGEAQRILNVPAQYPRIQVAVNAATNGETVLVAPGIYKETINFQGKAIHVKSSGGPRLTVIEGQVLFVANETSLSVLEGFHIRGQSVPQSSAGIRCTGSPTITRNWISGFTRAGSGGTDGAALVLSGSAARVIGNEFFDNVISAHRARGAAIFCAPGSRAFILGNVFTRNQVFGFAFSNAAGSALGGAVYCDDRVPRLANNDFYANLASASGYYEFPRGWVPGTGGGGGVYGGTVVNCIAYDNRLGGDLKSGADLMNSSAEYCCVKGGFPGVGNIAADPRFVNASIGDFHLRDDSPCRNAGSNLRLPVILKTDIDGNPRIAESVVDIGADEFFPHLYYTGTAARGSTIDLTFVGPAGQQVFFAFATRLANPPIVVPGLFGLLRLDPGSLAAIPVGPLPSTGYRVLPISFPASFPRGAIHTQALIGVRLTDLLTITIP